MTTTSTRETIEASRRNLRHDCEHFAEPRTPLPALSVTVLNYNYGRYLAECLTSILRQTFKDFEVIIIDDASTDNSLEVATPFLADPRVRLIAHATNRGFVESLIEGTEVHSRGEYVTVISADDFAADPGAFLAQIESLKASGAVMCYSAFVDVNTSGEIIQHNFRFSTSTIFDSEAFLLLRLTDPKTTPLHSGTILRRRAYLETGGYRRDLKYAIDSAMWMSLPAFGPVAFIVDELYAYRRHTGQMSSPTRRTEANRQVDENVMCVNGAFAAIRARGLDVPVSRTQALRKCLPATALVDAFSDRPQLCFIRLTRAATTHPWPILTARWTWVALARAVLGKRGYGLLRKLR